MLSKSSRCFLEHQTAGKQGHREREKEGRKENVEGGIQEERRRGQRKGKD